MKIAKVVTVFAVCLSISLALVETAQAQTVRFAIIGDRTGGHEPGIHEQIVDRVNYLRPDFVLSVGDHIEGYSNDSAEIEQEWDEYFDIVDKLQARYYQLPGNHDIWSDLSERIFRRRVAEPYYSFDKDGIHFVMIDLSRAEKGSDLSSEQLNWIAEDLKSNVDKRYTIVLHHKPFWYEGVFKNADDTLHSLYRAYGVDAVFNGHYHEYFVDEIDGIKYTAIGSSGAGRGEDASRIGYMFAWVTVDDEGIHVAPVGLNGVYAWDETTAEQKLIHDPVRHLGLSFADPILIGNDLRPIDRRARITLNNMTKFPLEDTIVWDIPEGWSVHPESMSVYVAPGDTASFDFLVENSGEVYPLPQASVRFTFDEGRQSVSSQPLRVARTAVCNRADSEPNLDGDIDEKFWKVSADQFFDQSGSPAKTEPVEFYFAHDDDNLYIAALCRESKIEKLAANVSEHDGAVYGEDCIGFFFEPVYGSDTVYQIYFNPEGMVFDQIIWRGEDGYMDSDVSWDGQYEIGTDQGEDFWAIEIAIPAGQFNADFKKNKDWRLNFRRKQKRLDCSSDWQIPIEYLPETFGYLEIK